ncbi:MAG: hypothetical protein A4E45_01660 [Methanosaeta sp. PtaB.Bin039]|nr:MAG: hypothetical protein A4E45_01660 [Methanosaeta sp. PtaB.Bin039]
MNYIESSGMQRVVVIINPNNLKFMVNYTTIDEIYKSIHSQNLINKFTLNAFRGEMRYSSTTSHISRRVRPCE